MANQALAERFPQSTNLCPVYLEKEFWREMSRGIETVEYGVNIDGTAFSSDPNDQLGQSKANLKVKFLSQLQPLFYFFFPYLHLIIHQYSLQHNI